MCTLDSTKELNILTQTYILGGRRRGGPRRVLENQGRASRCSQEQPGTRRTEKPIGPALTKDRNDNEIDPLEGIDSDVRMGSSSRDATDRDRIGNDGEDVQAQDAMGHEHATQVTSDRHASHRRGSSQRRPDTT